MAYKFALLLLLISISVNSTYAIKRKLEDFQERSLSKKYQIDYQALNLDECDQRYSIDYRSMPQNENNMLNTASSTFFIPPSLNRNNVLNSLLQHCQRQSLSAIAVVFNALQEALIDECVDFNKSEDEYIHYRKAIANALEDPLIINILGAFTAYFKIFIYNLHAETNAQRLFTFFYPLGKGILCEKILLASNKTLALARREILKHLEDGDWSAIEAIPEKIRFHPTMITDAGQSILVYLINSTDNINLNVVQLFIGHVTWNKIAAFEAAEKNHRLDIFQELKSFIANHDNKMLE